MTTDPRQIVEQGYDVAAADYARWVANNGIDAGRSKYLASFSELVPQGSTVLELGCGGGGPTTQTLADRYALTGIDISRDQIELARERAPRATLLQGDMTRVEFPAASFDGVAAFYSLIHLPYGELPGMFARISTWLREGGVLVATLNARDSGEHLEAEWLGGAPMYWSGHSPE